MFGKWVENIEEIRACIQVRTKLGHLEQQVFTWGKFNKEPLGVL
jgi:hypothetical protein